MLFDLKSGKRRRVVQIVFGFLAFIFFISFVGFGIGSDVSGGLFDALGIGGSGDSGGDVSSQYEQQIEEAEEDVADDPKDEKALTDLARYRYLSGQENLDFDESTGVAVLTDDARTEWNSALDAWEDLLKTDPKKVDVQVAGQMICAYAPPLPQCQIQAPTGDVNFKGAAATQELLATQDPSAENYAALAYYQYSDGNLSGGEQSAAKAVGAAEGSQRKKFEKGLDKLGEEAAKAKKAQEKAAEAGATGEEPGLQNPFGNLGGDTGAGGLPPTSP